MNAKTNFGFTIIQNDKSNLNNIRLKRKDILDKLKSDEDFKIVDCIEVAWMDDVVVTTHKLPENSQKVFRIYILFLIPICQRGKRQHVKVENVLRIQ